MSSDNATSKPATPRRSTPLKALSGLFRTPTRLRTPTTVNHRNKRTRARASSLSYTPTTPDVSPLPAVVLQTYSVSTDSIVLTALPSVPFCCHEDLLTMSRTQLEGVVRALNVRLPRRLRICPEDDFWQSSEQDLVEDCSDGDSDGLSRMSEVEMRKRIEELVGIRAVVGKNRVARSGLGLGSRTGVPPAPKAVRTRNAQWRPNEKTPWEMDVDNSDDHADDLNIMIDDALLGSSPLASRTKFGLHSRGRGGTLSHLAILQEENEGSDSKEDDPEDDELRPSKRLRVSSASVTEHSKEGSQTVHDVKESRLVENMDQSGSALLGEESDTLSCNLAESEARAVTTMVNLDGDVEMSQGVAEAPLQRRRSVRIEELALKRASLADTRMKTSMGARDLKSAFLRPRNSSRCLSGDLPMKTGGLDVGKDATVPKELTIRLPFTSTPPDQKSESFAWSTSRILRSHSQRLAKSSQATNTKASLGRSKSEKYPRASDLTFVTVNRPRYRFARRKSKVTEGAKGDQAPGHSSSLPSHTAFRPQQFRTEDPNQTYESEKENHDPRAAIRSPTLGGLQTLPSALCSSLVPRSRAPSTSTAASSQANDGDSPSQPKENEGATTGITMNDGATEHVWEALGRMVVGSL